MPDGFAPPVTRRRAGTMSGSTTIKRFSAAGQAPEVMCSDCHKKTEQDKSNILVFKSKTMPVRIAIKMYIRVNLQENTVLLHSSLPDVSAVTLY